MGSTRSVLSRSILRALLRAARPFDGPHGTTLRALLSRPRAAPLFEPDDVEEGGGGVRDKLLRLVKLWAGPSAFFQPREGISPLGEAIRQEWRKSGEERHAEEEEDADERLDVALAALRFLRAALARGEAAGMLLTEGWTPAKAPGAAADVTPVDETAALEPGTLLVAHPMVDDYFARSVVLLFGASGGSGPSGVVLNAAVADASVASLQLSTSSGAQKDSGEEVVDEVVEVDRDVDEGERARSATAVFDANPLMRGGPVRSLHVLHSCTELGGNKVVGDVGDEDSVFAGCDLRRAMRLVEEGTLAPSELQFFVGESSWSVGQLEGEIADGVWCLARGTPELVREVIAASLGAGCPEQGGDAQWARVLSALGPDHAALAGVPRTVLEQPGDDS